LWWVEIEGGRIGNRAPDGPRLFDIGGRPNGAAFDENGILWIADQGLNVIRRFEPVTGRASIVADSVDGLQLGKPNDLCFDASGRLIFTCSNNARAEPVGYICRMTPDGEVKKIADGLMFPNGLALCESDRLLVAETYRQCVVWASYGEAFGSFAATPGPVGPDGMAIATDGSVFVANFGQGSISRYGPNGGLIDTLEVPGSKPTNVALDPTGILGLVVTEVESGAIFSSETLALPSLQIKGAGACST
jgi:gluconolactonase